MPSTQELRLPQVVSDRLLFIPDYQRPYAWEDKQLADLWEDLDLLGPHGTHYAGTLVLRAIPRDDDGGGVDTSVADDGATLQHCEVVDGQQRLTTCLLLLDRIRRRVDALAVADVANAADMASRLRATYGMVSVDNALQPRLRLGAGMNSYWVETVLGEHQYAGPPLIAGQAQLRDAATFYDKRLDGLTAEVDKEEQFARLKELQRRITAGLGFLVYEVHSASEVGVIFETLNERGRPLTELEKTKNYLLYLARTITDARGDQLAEKINEAWSDIFSNLARESADADDQLLRAHWLATQNPDRSAWKRIASVKAKFDRSNYVSSETRIVPAAHDYNQEQAWDRLFADVDAYVTSLRDCSHFLAEMFDPQAAFATFSSHTAEARGVSAALRRSGVVALYRPLLFASRLRHPTDGQLYSRLVDLCERYSARVFVVEQRRSNAGEPRLLRLANDLYKGSDPDHVCQEVTATLWQYAPDDRVATTLRSTAENWYGRRGHKYFLYEYERSLMGHSQQELPALSYFTDSAREQRTTEHVLPQNPDPAATCWWDAFSAEEHASLKHALGNLVLTYDNSSYSNKCFNDKKGHALQPEQAPIPCYAQASLKQEQLLALFDEWTPEQIQQRQNDLADWAVKRWEVEPPTAQLVNEDVDIEPEGTDDDLVAPDADAAA
jgi:hypothetical protein